MRQLWWWLMNQSKLCNQEHASLYNQFFGPDAIIKFDANTFFKGLQTKDFEIQNVIVN